MSDDKNIINDAPKLSYEIENMPNKNRNSSVIKESHSKKKNFFQFMNLFSKEHWDIQPKRKSLPKFHMNGLKKNQNGHISKIKPKASNLQETNNIQIESESFNKIENNIAPKEGKETKIDSTEDKQPQTQSTISLSNQNSSISYPATNNYDFLTEEVEISKIIKDINNDLKQKNIDVNELIKKLQVLFDICPVINEFKNTKKLLESKDFDIFIKDEASKFFFQINIVNLIPLINLLYTITNNIDKFKECLSKLNIYFSFIKRKNDENDNEYDFIILCPESAKLYNYISTYSKELFPLNSKYQKEAEIFLESKIKQTLDEGYFLEESCSMNLINKIGIEKVMYFPKIMYYLKKDAAEKLIKLYIITPPEKYVIAETNINESGKKFHGYNEIDICFTLLDDAEIKGNENIKFFSKEKESKEIEQKDSYIFKKDITYFIEIKESIFGIKDKLDETEKHFARFKNSFLNAKIKKNKEDKLIFICDKSMLDLRKEYKKGRIKEDIIYSNPQVGMRLIFELNDRIKHLSKNVETNEEQISSLKQENAKEIAAIKKESDKKISAEIAAIKKESDKKISALQTKIEEFEKMLLKDVYNECKNTLENFSFLKPGLILLHLKGNKNLSELFMKSLEELFDCFNRLSNNYLKIAKYEGKESLYNNIVPFIGEVIKNDEDIKKWKNIQKTIENKINTNSKFSPYYKGLLEFLFGQKYINGKGEIDLDILSKEKSDNRNYVKKLILFLEVCDLNESIKLIEEKFNVVVIYIMLKMKGARSQSIFESFKSDNNKEIRELIVKLISCLNYDNNV